MGFLSQTWLGSPKLALYTIVVIIAWQFAPFHTLIFQAGRRAIASELYDAASVDGANVRQYFGYVTLPQLRYSIVTSSTLVLVGSLTCFDIIYILTQGGPSDSTRVLAMDMYNVGFNQTEFGYASAIATVLASRFAAFVLGTIWLVFVLAPVYYMVLISFRSPAEYLTANAWLPTGGLTLSSYLAVVDSSGIGTYFRNSAELVVGTIAVVVSLSLLAGYRIVRRASRSSAVSFRAILFGIAVPIQAIVIPLYFMANKMHIYDTMFGLVLVLVAFLILVPVLLMVNYLRLIPGNFTMRWRSTAPGLGPRLPTWSYPWLAR